MFSNTGIPKLRFKGYDEYKKDVISNMFKISRGQVLAKNLVLTYAKFPVYSSQTQNNGLLGYYNDYLFEDAITWTTDGANAGTVNFRNGKFYCTNVCGVLLEKKYKPNLYFSTALSKVTKKYVSFTIGNPKLMNNTMAKIEILFSSNINEQQKIAKFLSLFDSKINKIIQKINLSEYAKKYYLKYLFL